MAEERDLTDREVALLLYGALMAAAGMLPHQGTLTGAERILIIARRHLDPIGDALG